MSRSLSLFVGGGIHMTHDAVFIVSSQSFIPHSEECPRAYILSPNASAHRNDNHDGGRDETPQRCKYMGPHSAIATSSTRPDEVDVCGHIVGTSDSTCAFHRRIALGIVVSSRWQLGVEKTVVSSFEIEVQM